MAKSKADKINKSQLVRDYLEEHPRAKPRQIRPAIKAAFGVDISPQMISMIKSKSGKSGGRSKAGRRSAAGVVRAKPARSITAEQLLAAKKLIDQVGGVEHARVLLDVLAKLS